jgi:uncharacterized membrane protein YjjP (DUF1212 family)
VRETNDHQDVVRRLTIAEQRINGGDALKRLRRIERRINRIVNMMALVFAIGAGGLVAHYGESHGAWPVGIAFGATAMLVGWFVKPFRV